MTILNAVLLGFLKIDLMALCQLVAMKIHGWVGAPLLDTGFFLPPSLHYQFLCIFVSLPLLPFHKSYIFPFPASPWAILSPVFPHFTKCFHLLFPGHPPLSS